jgi:beta-xylosidase
MSLVAAVSLAVPARADTSGANATHDPSRIVESDGKFYSCSTGGKCASSLDGLVWSSTGLHLDVPARSTTYMPGGNQGVWAPDLVYFDSKYHLYYSGRALIGLASGTDQSRGAHQRGEAVDMNGALNDRGRWTTARRL